MVRRFGAQHDTTKIRFSPDGKFLATASDDKTAKLWDVASGRLLQNLSGSIGANGDQYLPFCIAFSPDGKLLAVGEADRRVKLWDLRSVSVAGTLTGFAGPVWGVAFSPDGRLLATAAANTPLTLWDAASRRQVGRLVGSQAMDAPLLFSPDGQTLITGYSRTTPWLWDLATRQPRAVLAARGGIDDLSPDGKTLAAGHLNTVVLSSLISGQEVCTLRGHTGGLWSLRFSPDGNTLATASEDGTVRLWHAPPFQETDSLRVIAGSGDRQVQLQWRPLSWARGYGVYRGAAGARPEQLQRIAVQPAAGTLFVDHDPALVNGRPQTYAVAPVFSAIGNGAAGAGDGTPIGELNPVNSAQRSSVPRLLEGARATVNAEPTCTPPGFFAYSTHEAFYASAALLDTPAGQIDLRGSGADMRRETDGYSFVGQPQAGDFRMTVMALSPPAGASEWAAAGLMLRESPELGARYLLLCLTAQHGMRLRWRPAANSGSIGMPVTETPALKFPAVLRLTRRRDMVSAEYSLDGGNSFRPSADPVLFRPAPARTLYAGLAITSNDPTRVSRARFRGLQIERP